jgi:hypothetical protein
MIHELLLLQSSDWGFICHQQDGGIVCLGPHPRARAPPSSPGYLIQKPSLGEADVLFLDSVSSRRFLTVCRESLRSAYGRERRPPAIATKPSAPSGFRDFLPEQFRRRSELVGGSGTTSRSVFRGWIRRPWRILPLWAGGRWREGS